MTLTTKDSSDPASPSKPAAQARNPESKAAQTPRSNPVCLEVSVTIRSLPAESGGSFQPIREDGRTVIVFDNGAVLRCASNLPVGQTVILSNPSGRDVICKIVGARNMPSIKGYVEVEFIEPVDDYWHIHEQNEPAAVAAPQPAASPPAARAEARTRTASEKPTVLPSGTGPSFDDIAGLVSPPSRPPTREKRVEQAKSLGDAQAPNASGQTFAETAEWVSSGSRNGKAEIPAAREAAAGDSESWAQSSDFASTSLLASSQASTSSSGLHDGMPLRIAAAALLLAIIGGGMYFMQRGSAPGSVAQGAAPKQASAAEPPAPAKNNEAEPVTAAQAGLQPQPAVAIHAEPAQSIAPAPAKVSNAVARDLPSVQRQEKSLPLPDKNANADQPSDQPAPRSDAIPNLKMKSPSAPRRNLAGQPEGPVPVGEIAPPVSAGGISSPELLTAVTRSPNQPAPPPTAPVGTTRDAKLISSANAVYPQAAKVANIQGSVVVLAHIDASGNVVDVKAESGPMLLRQAALESVRRWKYSPALADGKPVSTQVAVTVDFKLN